MAKMKRRIKVTKDQYLDNGYYQTVYRISPRRIVKVPRQCFSERVKKEILEGEVKGSKTFNYSLPVLDIVDVELPSGDVVEGTLRRYIPNKLTDDEFDDIEEKHDFDGWDNHSGNFRVDYTGNVWRIDTQFEYPD